MIFKKILFFGGDKLYSYPIFKHLVERNLYNFEIITNSFCNELINYAKKSSISYHIIPKNSSFYIDQHFWQSLPLFYNSNNDYYDIGLVCSFGHYIPDLFINKCYNGIINAHPSLLPKYPGSSPIFTSIINGDSETGVSIIQLHSHNIDKGSILMQRSCPIEASMTYPQLTSALVKLSCFMLDELLSNHLNYSSKMIPQKPPFFSMTVRSYKKFRDLILEQQSSLNIFNIYRALYGQYSLRLFFKFFSINLNSISFDPFISPSLYILSHYIKPFNLGRVIYDFDQKILWLKTIDHYIKIHHLSFNNQRLSAETFAKKYKLFLPEHNHFISIHFSSKSTPLPLKKQQSHWTHLVDINPPYTIEKIKKMKIFHQTF